MTNLIPMNYKEQRIMTTNVMAESFGTDVKIISNNFNRNIERFTEGKHFYKLEGEELRQFKANHLNDEYLKFAPSLYLWTERGAARHAKILETDEAWEVYEQLEETYFKVKESSIDTAQLSEQTQMFLLIGQAVANNELAIKRAEKLAIEAKQETFELKETIKETFAIESDNLREWTSTSLNKIVKHSGISYQDIRNESYKQLEEKAHCNLSERVRRAKVRMTESGARKSDINAYCKLSAIFDEPRLKEIYVSIIQKMLLKYAA